MVTAFLRPRSENPDLRSRELVLNYILFGTGLLAVFAMLGELASYADGKTHSLDPTFAVGAALLLMTVWLFWLSRTRGHHYAAGYIIIGFYFFIASFLVSQWGLQLPTAALLLGLVIVMAGTIINSRFSLYMVGCILVVLSLLHYLTQNGFIHPSLEWKKSDPSTGDLFGFLIMYSILALVSWGFNRQMEQALQRAHKSEAALRRQKNLLEVKVNERGRQLAEAQFEKVQQVYRFAELGRLSSALFHDMANHLTSVSLDIEGLRQEDRSEIMGRVQGTIGYIDDVVQRVRGQLKTPQKIERFIISNEIDEIFKILSYKAIQDQVALSIEISKGNQRLTYVTNIIRFRQVINNLVTNAIEAYPAVKGTRKPKIRRVLLTMTATEHEIIITVTDHGKGISPELKARIFEPFYTTKQQGTGIGLFIVKQIVEQDMDGSLTVTSNRQQGTSFQLRLPRQTE